jgi:hypothetical protein
MSYTNAVPKEKYDAQFSSCEVNLGLKGVFPLERVGGGRGGSTGNDVIVTSPAPAAGVHADAP